MRLRTLFVAAPVALLAVLPSPASAAQCGFVHSTGVSFSSEPVFAGTAVKAYAVVINNAYRKLTATVAFIDNAQEFARATTEVPEEEARQVSVIWPATYGNHIVAAKIVSATVMERDGTTRQLSQNEISQLATPVSRTTDIDNDSDRDNIGDHDEIATYGTEPLSKDTDADGLSDYDEIFKYKTNPKNKNTDGDNMDDGDEVRSGRNPLVKDDPLPPPPPPQPPVIEPEPAKPVVQPAPNPAPATKQASNPTTKKPVAVKTTKTVQPAPTPATLEEAVATTTLSTTTAETQPIDATPIITTSDPVTPAAADDENNWVVVLGVVAALLAVAAAVSGALAWRERNRY